MIRENKKIQEFITENGSSTKCILDIFDERISDTYFICLYSSYAEGLGTADSDLDIYIFTKENQKKFYGNKEVWGFMYKRQAKIGKLLCDIEFWDIDEFLEMLHLFYTEKNFNINDDILKILLRISIGTCSYKGEESIKILNMVQEIDLKKKVQEYYALGARSYYSDALQLSNDKDFISAMLLFKEAIKYALGALNASYGKANMKDKWILRSFINNPHLKNTDLLKEVEKMILYPKVERNDIEKYCEDLSSLCQCVLLESEIE